MGESGGGAARWLIVTKKIVPGDRMTPPVFGYANVLLVQTETMELHGMLLIIRRC